MYKLYKYPVLIRSGSIIIPKTLLQYGGADMLRNCIDGICNLFNNKDNFDDEPNRASPRISSNFQALPADGLAQEKIWDSQSRDVGYDVTPGSKIILPSDEHLEARDNYFRKQKAFIRRRQEENIAAKIQRDKEYRQVMKMKRN